MVLKARIEDLKPWISSLGDGAIAVLSHKNGDMDIMKNKSRKKINVKGPYSADTFFQSKNLLNFDVVVGMYHDQVLTPIKTLFEYDAINITLGLPFIRVSPDHGPNKKMVGKNKSNPISLIKALSFLDKK